MCCPATTPSAAARLTSSTVSARPDDVDVVQPAKMERPLGTELPRDRVSNAESPGPPVYEARDNCQNRPRGPFLDFPEYEIQRFTYFHDVSKVIHDGF